MPLNVALCRECGKSWTLPGAPPCGHSQLPPADSPLGQLVASFRSVSAETAEAELSTLRASLAAAEEEKATTGTGKEPESSDSPKET